MDDKTIFGGTINLAAKSLDLRSKRHELLLSNIANADTPNYKAFDLLVEKALSKLAPSAEQVPLHQTNPGHMPNGGISADNVRPEVLQLSTQFTLRGDGNTVDMDREMAGLASNQLQYRLASQIIAKKFQGLKNVIKGDQT